MKIKDIKITGNLRNVEPSMIPDFYELNENVSVTIHFENMRPAIFTGKTNFLFDYASIPNTLGWFIEKDHEMLLVASFVHDICFNYKYNSKQWSAELMYEIMRWWLRNYMPFSFKRFILKLKSRVIKKAVSGIIAQRMFDDTNEIDIHNRKLSRIY